MEVLSPPAPFNTEVLAPFPCVRAGIELRVREAISRGGKRSLHPTMFGLSPEVIVTISNKACPEGNMEVLSPPPFS